MKHRLLSLWPYLLALVFLYYVFPLSMGALGPFLPLLVFMPALCLVCGFVCGLRQGFRPLLPAAAVLLFLPTLFLYYNTSAWVYAPAFGLLCLAGVLLGGHHKGS